MNPFAPRKYGELQKITDRVYIYRNITNSSFVIGDRGVAVIDTQVNFPTAECVLRAIQSVTDKPILYAINTHYHWDHTNGNTLFKKQGAEIVSSKLTQEFMTVRAPRQKEFLSGRGFELGRDPLLPEITFENKMSLDLGGMPLELFFAGKAESDDATAVHVPSEGIVMSGDTVMTGSFPIFGQPVWDEGLQDGEWIRTIQNLTALNPKHIVPGHGPLAHQAEVDLLIKIQAYFLKEVQACVNRGMGAMETLSEVEQCLPQWITSIPLVWGTPRYAILRVWRGLTKKTSDDEIGWQQFKPSAIPSKNEKGVDEKLLACTRLQDYIQMARECAEGGDDSLRISILKRATQLFSSFPEAYAQYAEALIECSRREASVLEKGDFFHEARVAWEKALTIDPCHASALLGKGRYLVMMAYRGGDDPAEGMNLLQKTLEVVSDEALRAEAKFYLGMGHRRLGDEVSAKKQFLQALKSNPSFMPAALASQ